jgi:hypothetical protein
MNEISSLMRSGGAKMSTAIQRINHPTHKGAPNPAHGKFFFVGSIPAACYDLARNEGRGGSKLYDTEASAIQAAIEAGADRIQGVDCKFVKEAA